MHAKCRMCRHVWPYEGEEDCPACDRSDWQWVLDEESPREVELIRIYELVEATQEQLRRRMSRIIDLLDILRQVVRQL